MLLKTYKKKKYPYWKRFSYSTFFISYFIFWRGGVYDATYQKLKQFLLFLQQMKITHVITLCANMVENVNSMWAEAIIPSSGATVGSDSQENFVKNVNAHIFFFINEITFYRMHKHTIGTFKVRVCVAVR